MNFVASDIGEALQVVIAEYLTLQKENEELRKKIEKLEKRKTKDVSKT